MNSLGFYKLLILGLLGVFCLVSSPLSCPALDNLGVSNKKVVILGLDGCRFGAIQAAQTPNFDLILSDSLWSNNAKILPGYYLNSAESMTSSSWRGWATILSGVWQDSLEAKKITADEAKVHTKYNHHRVDKEHQGLSIFDRLENLNPNYHTVSFTSWPEINAPISLKVDREESFFDAELLPHTCDQRVADAFSRLILKSQAPDLTFLHFAQSVSVRMRDGYWPQSEAYLDSIERIDQLLGQVVKSISDRVKETKEEWLILLTSDQIGSGIHHNLSLDNPDTETTFLVAFGPSADPGKILSDTYIVDVAALVLDHLGLNIESMVPAIDGRLPRDPTNLSPGIISTPDEKIGASIISKNNPLGTFDGVKNLSSANPKLDLYDAVGSGLLQFESLSQRLSQLEIMALGYQKSEILHIFKVFKFSVYLIVPIFLFSLCGMVYSGVIHGKSINSALQFISRNIQSGENMVDCRTTTDPNDFDWIEKQDFYDSTPPKYVAAYNAFKESSRGVNHGAKYKARGAKGNTLTN